jgi:diadenosine tetraphosphate (Ap4A) HIT family hydrolase
MPWIHFDAMPHRECPFCNLAKQRIILQTETTLAFFDGFPVAEGHTLVIPKRHVASIFELPPEELAALWQQVEIVRNLLADLKPDGFNIGVNDGPAAGQTIMHAHIHVIPRRTGDSTDPRGGIRWVMPGNRPSKFSLTQWP